MGTTKVQYQYFFSEIWVKSKILEQIPMGRFAAPEEIADVVLFLCNVSYITGTVIDVNGDMR